MLVHGIRRVPGVQAHTPLLHAKETLARHASGDGTKGRPYRRLEYLAGAIGTKPVQAIAAGESVTMYRTFENVNGRGLTDAIVLA